MGVPLRLVPTEEAGQAARAPASSTPPDQTAEMELVARCQRGDPRAFDELYLAYRRQVVTNLYRLLGGRPDLEDTLQEVFIETFRSIGRFRGEARLSTWLYRVTSNVAYRRLRTRRRKEPPSTPVSEHLAGSEADPESLLQSRRDLAAVHRVLDRLAPKKRIVFVLHELEGRPIEEIATIVDAPRVTVRTRLHYARKEFFSLAGKLGLADRLPDREES